MRVNAVLIDSRDDRVCPSVGTLVDATLESHGWPGSTVRPYIKAELAMQKHWNISKMFDRPPATRFANPFANGGFNPVGTGTALGATEASKAWFGVPAEVTGCVASLAMNIGAILPLCRDCRGGASGPLVPLVDRYTLGGPFSLRGFDLHSVGNQAEACAFPTISPGKTPTKGTGGEDFSVYDADAAGRALGSLSRGSLIAALSVPIPVVDIAKAGGRAFVFANVGGLGGADCPGTVAGSSVFGAPRVSIGGGFAFNFASQARIEVTYSVPVHCTPRDQINTFQFGIGLTIM